jgi:lipid-binding SYLF domain-containing protein
MTSTKRIVVAGLRVGLIFTLASSMLVGAGCTTTPPTNAERTALQDEATAAISRMAAKDSTLRPVLNSAVAYAVFPSVGKGAFIVGGAYGHGVLYERGKRVGYCDITQGTIGASIGAASVSEVIVFDDRDMLEQFKLGNFRWTATASAVAVKAGAAATTQFENGVAIFADADAGLMGDASVGGQRYTYQPN